jgi:predicted TPR repeat methyltransferase
MCDLGCGTGWLTTILGNFGPTIGVDLSDEAVLAASKRYPNADFVHANVLDWHGPSQMFDIVVSQEVIEHVEDQDGYLGIAANLLKSSGFLILTTPNLDAVKALPKPNRSTQPIENWLDRVKLRGLAERHFTDVRITTIIPARSQSVIARLIGSGRLRSILRSVRLYPLWEHLTLRWGLGLHFLLIARKR